MPPLLLECYRYSQDIIFCVFISPQVRTKQYKRGSMDGEGEEYEEYEEESEEEDDESVDTQQEQITYTVTEAGGHTIPAEGAQQLVDDVNSASNKLLQFCSQVVNSETV